MQHTKWELELAQFCAPALFGLKPANLVCFSKEQFPSLPSLLKGYQKTFLRFGIRLEVVCSCNFREMVLVYQPALLAQQLSRRCVEELLIRDGYPGGSMQSKLEYLKRRLAQNQDFPHEIGLFLGYPVSDVLAFQRTRGEGCKLCGYWKVYGNVEAAKRCFARFDACRAALIQALHDGKTLTQVLEASLIHTA